MAFPKWALEYGEGEQRLQDTTANRPLYSSKQRRQEEKQIRRGGRAAEATQIVRLQRRLKGWLTKKCVLLDIYKKLKHAGSDKMVLFAMWPGVADSGTDIWETSPELDLQ